MATTTVSVDGLTDALNLGFSFATYLDDIEAELTTEHPTSSYGRPVKDGVAYGPGDLRGVTLHLAATVPADTDLIAPAKAAGWAVRVHAWCDYCGEALSSPETRNPGDRHPDCEAR